MGDNIGNILFGTRDMMEHGLIGCLRGIFDRSVKEFIFNFSCFGGGINRCINKEEFL